jgi:hypothetical protein
MKKSGYMVLLIVVCLLQGGNLMAQGEPGTRFIQDRFGIGLWVDPPADENLDARYKQLKEAGFTFVISFHANGNTPVQAQQVLDVCDKYDLKVLLSYQGVPLTDLIDGPACWGYCLKDEPNAAEFGDLRTKVDLVRSQRPGKLGYINLFPNYASPWGQLGAVNYDEYVRLFVQNVEPDVLSMDHYPQFKPGVDGRDGYCSDLAVMRKYALQKDIPFWNFFNVMPYGPHTDPTESQLRWQIYSSLTYGAKGVMYFCYYTPEGGEFPKGGAIIGVDNEPTRHYEQATRINHEILNLGPTLMKLTSTGIHRIQPGNTDTPATILQGTVISDIRRDAVDPELNLLVGTFQHEDGRQAVMLMNYEFAYTSWPTVDFTSSNVVEVDKKTGQEKPVKDDSPNMEGLQLSLDAGDARLFLIPGPPAPSTILTK